jgi:branched-chain amino acid transport system substrate-binding protein
MFKASNAIAMAVILITSAAQIEAQAIDKISDDIVKIGVIEDMSSIYADIAGMGAVTAANMAIEDFGGQVLGKPIQLVYGDHQNKADLASAIASEWFDNQHVDALLDVAASATALAAMDVARAKNKIVILSGPAAIRITNEACGPSSVHWNYDTYAVSHGTGQALVKQGYDTWFFITADYAFGHDLKQNAAQVVVTNGGKVLGEIKLPINTSDFSSALLQAQSSKAKVVALANAGADAINSIKQAAEFGVMRSGQKIAGLVIFISDINSLGLEMAQGMLVTEAFYWNMDEGTRAWSHRFFKRMNKMPTSVQASLYSSTMHYLKAIQAAGTDQTVPVMQQMRSMPVHDFFAKNGRIREDGRLVHDMYLFEVKKPSESVGLWDYYNLVATIPADEAFQPLSRSRCSLVKRTQ